MAYFQLNHQQKNRNPNCTIHRSGVAKDLMLSPTDTDSQQQARATFFLVKLKKVNLSASIYVGYLLGFGFLGYGSHFLPRKPGFNILQCSSNAPLLFPLWSGLFSFSFSFFYVQRQQGRSGKTDPRLETKSNDPNLYLTRHPKYAYSESRPET